MINSNTVENNGVTSEEAKATRCVKGEELAILDDPHKVEQKNSSFKELFSLMGNSQPHKM